MRRCAKCVRCLVDLCLVMKLSGALRSCGPCGLSVVIQSAAAQRKRRLCNSLSQVATSVLLPVLSCGTKVARVIKLRIKSVPPAELAKRLRQKAPLVQLEPILYERPSMQ